MLDAIRLTKRYADGTLALRELDLVVNPGEIYCLLGANGAGKSTTINLFLDFLAPTSGRALINGIDANHSPLQAKRYLAYIPENVALYDNFTARENLDFFARLGGRQDLRKEDYSAIMSEAGLPPKAFDQRVKEFSKGMRQKLGIGICLARSAKALLLDEPTSGLDPKAAWEFVEALLEMRERGVAILMSTHDVFRAKELADRLGILKEGNKLVEMSRPQLANENLEQLYLHYMRATTEVPGADESDSRAPGSLDN